MSARENTLNARLNRLADALSRVLSAVFVAAVAISLVEELELVRSLAHV